MSGRTNIKGTKGYDPDYAKQIHKKNIESAGASWLIDILSAL